MTKKKNKEERKIGPPCPSLFLNPPLFLSSLTGNRPGDDCIYIPFNI
jgi:hypothetical protein